MSTSFVDEYLVKLGSSVDQSGMARFAQALREAQNVATASSGNIAASFFRAQTEITAGFLAIGASAVGLVDKVAMADQSYRLLALHMRISKTAARDLQIGLDALGTTLADATWDPELRARMHQLIEDQRAMAPEGNGANFEEQMKKIRDIRFQFTRMEVEGQYLAMNAVNSFLTALGMGPDTLLQKLERFNDYVVHHMPEISTWLTNKFLPIWHDVEKVTLDVYHGVDQATLAFTNLIGILSGDHSIIGTTNNLDHFATALDHVGNGFAGMVDKMLHGETRLLKLANAAELMGSGHWKEGWAELKDATELKTGAEADKINAGRFNPITSAFNAMSSSINGQSAPGSNMDMLNIEVLRGLQKLGLNVQVPPSYAASVAGGSSISPSVSGKVSTAEANASVHALIDKYTTSVSGGLYRALAHAIAMHESGETEYDKHGAPLKNPTSSATGVFQLTQATAKFLGVDATDTEQNVKGGIKLLEQLLKRYNGDLAAAVGAFQIGAGNIDKVLARKATLDVPGSNEKQSENNIAEILRAVGVTGDVHVGNIVVHVTKDNAVNADVASAVAAKIQETQNKRIQRNQYEASDQGWSYQ